MKKKKKSLFYLMTPLKHIDFSYHRLLDIKHMVIMTYFFRQNPLSSHRLLFLISRKGSFMHFPTDRTAHTTTFDGQLVDHWLEQKVAQTANNLSYRLDRIIPTFTGECSTAELHPAPPSLYCTHIYTYVHTNFHV